MTRLADIAKRCEAATKGPWRDVPLNDWTDSTYIDGPDFASARIDMGECELVALQPQIHADAAFIAHAREDAPWLLAHLALADAVVEASRHAVKDHGLDAEHEYFEALAAYDRQGGE